jgi:outer membrane protein assembly factor BamD
MKALRTLIVATLAAVAVGGGPLYGEGKAAAQSQTQTTQPALTREQRRAERAKRIATRATESTKLKIREGKSPNYNRLLKSTEYKLMYTEGLRYFNTMKKDSDRPSLANLRKAQTLFATVAQQQALSGTPQEDSLYFYYGASFFRAQDYQASQDIFDNFRRRYGSSRFIERVEYMYASGFYELSPDPKNDQTITVRAISAISEFLGRYPETEHREICEQRLEILRRKLYTKSYENARLYYTIGRYSAAVRALNNAIDEYPQSPFREELMYLATRSAYLYAKNSVASQMTNRYLSMMDNYYNLVSEYPETRHLREVEQMRDEARKHIETTTASQTASETSTTTL